MQNGNNSVIESFIGETSNNIYNRNDICNDNVGTDNCYSINIPASPKDNEENDSANFYNHENTVNTNIFRYKFTDNFTNELYKFSKIQV
jgi:hypothetical protein